MTDSTTETPVENVRKGTLSSLIAIPLAILVFAVIGGWGGYVIFIVSLFIPSAALTLYRAGAGGVPAKGRVQFIVVATAAVVIGVFTGLVARAFGYFSAVGGDGGLFGSVFQSTLLRSLGTEEFIAQALVGLGLGVAGVFVALSSAKSRQNAKTAPVISTDLPAGTAAPGTPIAPPAATPPIAKPSPGIVLNGEPFDPLDLK